MSLLHAKKYKANSNNATIYWQMSASYIVEKILKTEYRDGSFLNIRITMIKILKITCKEKKKNVVHRCWNIVCFARTCLNTRWRLSTKILPYKKKSNKKRKKKREHNISLFVSPLQGIFEGFRHRGFKCSNVRGRM